MRVFVTGATGFVGSAAVERLLEAGHDVHGLARSDTAAAALMHVGVRPVRGTLRDPLALRQGAGDADAVLHLAIARGDDVRFAEALEVDRAALHTLGSSLVGSDRSLVFASATSMIEPGSRITEGTVGDLSDPSSRGSAETAVLAWADHGVKVAAVRLPTLVHGEGDQHGFLPMLMEVARERGVSAYVGDGQNRWPGVHRRDAGHLLRVVVESCPGAARLHAVAEEGVAFREIAEAIGDKLSLPARSIQPSDVGSHFSRLGELLTTLPAVDIPAASTATRELFSWSPSGPGVLDDVRSSAYPAA